MALRVTQAGVEALVLPTSANLRLTQAGVEVLIGPASVNLRLTQAGVEVLIARPTGTNCGDGWTIPTPDPFPVPNRGGPLYKRFQEMEGDWRTYNEKFPDGCRDAATLLSAKVRTFEIDYEGLSEAWAAQLDTHYTSTRKVIPFTLEHPQTGEVLTNVRYEEYQRPPHQRKWAQERKMRLIKYPV